MIDERKKVRVFIDTLATYTTACLFVLIEHVKLKLAVDQYIASIPVRNKVTSKLAFELMLQISRLRFVSQAVHNMSQQLKHST